MIKWLKNQMLLHLVRWEESGGTTPKKGRDVKVQQEMRSSHVLQRDPRQRTRGLFHIQDSKPFFKRYVLHLFTTLLQYNA